MFKNLHTTKSKGKLFTIVSILIIVTVMASVLPMFTQPAAAATCSKKYTVVAGDTLSSIAAKYSTTVQVLAQLNDLKDPYVLSVGQTVCLPASATAVTATASASSSSSSKAKYDMTLTRSGTRITLKVASFPTKSNFLVKVGETMYSPGWSRIGKIKTNKNGVGEATFGLPDNLRKVPSYYICVKNQVTDKLVCKKVTQPVPTKVTTKVKATATPKP